MLPKVSLSRRSQCGGHLKVVVFLNWAYGLVLLRKIKKQEDN
jgi:hypothetical protein